MTQPQVRCAIYTRKSSEEGLEQSFNSLDAQREAAEAYVLSQAHEGWTLLTNRYDDGGFSGGTMERPGLQRLLIDIVAGKVDIVVVYKIDRLTRSLADFARIVETFEAAGTSFVSVTQAFNTTTSMGRLMLNVLLSFAQFEREVTGERIRDKIAASKAKGLWMGGNVPLGYDVPAPGSRILQANPGEADTVRGIFRRYLELGSVHALQVELARTGVVSKQRITGTGKVYGGKPLNRGALYHLLANPIYRGMIRHKDVIHEGGHEEIVEQDLFDAVQAMLAGQAPRKRASVAGRFERAALTGRLFDASGEKMTPCFSRGSKGGHYRYYVSASLQRGVAAAQADVLRRIAAADIERLVTSVISRWLPDAATPLTIPLAVGLREDGIVVDLPVELGAEIEGKLGADDAITSHSPERLQVHHAIALPLRGGRARVASGAMPSRPDPYLIGALRKAHAMLDRDRGRPSIAEAPAAQHDRKLLRLALLAPDIQHAILVGRQPASLHLERLRHMELPLDWTQQRQMLGFAQKRTASGVRWP